MGNCISVIFLFLVTVVGQMVKMPPPPPVKSVSAHLCMQACVLRIKASSSCLRKLKGVRFFQGST